jgi:hypothetical protein
VTVVTRLVTFVDLDESGTDCPQLSLSVRHEAVLTDETRVPLLDDRGWTTSRRENRLSRGSDAESPQGGQHHVSAIWSVDAIEGTARLVVGADEPPHGRSREDMEGDHWAYLSSVLRQHGVVVDALVLRRVPHDVVLSQRLLARFGPKPRTE